MKVEGEKNALEERDLYVKKLGGEIYHDSFSHTNPPTSLDYGENRLSQQWSRMSFIRKDGVHIASFEYRTKDSGRTFTINKTI